MSLDMSTDSISSSDFLSESNLTMSLEFCNSSGVYEHLTAPQTECEQSNLINVSPDLDITLEELLIAPPFSLDDAKRYAARRIQKMVNQVEAKYRCLNEISEITTPEKPQDSPSNRFTDMSFQNRVLNETYVEPLAGLNETFVEPLAGLKETFVEPLSGSSFKMQKSFSSSCLPRENELEEDSLLVECGLDEMGLPVWRYNTLSSRTKSNPDLSETIARFQALKTSIFGQPQRDLQDQEEEENLNGTYLKSSSDNPDVEMMSNQPTTSKGPMKALAPLQSMTKQSLKNLPSVTKKTEPLQKNVKPHLGESFDEYTPPYTSTPTDKRSGRRQNPGNSTFSRSLSEGRMTPVKKTLGNVLKVSYVKPNVQNQKLSVPKLVTSKPLQRPSLINPKIGGSLLKRPSTAPLKPNNAVQPPLEDKTNRTITANISKVGRNQANLKRPTSLQMTQTVGSKKHPFLVSKSRRMSSLSKEN